MTEQSPVKRRRGGIGTEIILAIIIQVNFHRWNFFWVTHSSSQIKMAAKIGKKKKTKQIPCWFLARP